MNHSELIFLRNAIQDLEVKSLYNEMASRQTELSSIKRSWPTVKNHPLEYDKFKTEMQTEFNNVTHSMAYIDQLKRDYIQHIYKIIRDETFETIVEENKYYSQPNVRYRSANYFRHKELKMTEISKEVIRARIGFYIDWRYPGLEIGPGDATWTKELVAADPLYVVDYNDEFLGFTKQSFNEKYRNRLRCYKNMGEGLHMIPQNQMGFVFSWNTFNYFSMSQIKKYVKEIWNVLQPGGSCIFSYNNAERPHSALRSEERLMTFIPEQILTKIIRSFGFINVVSRDCDSAVSWVEFQKPGKLSSQRGGQTLGKIIRTVDA